MDESFREVTRLRKAGQLSDAERLGRKLFGADKSDRYVRGALAWVYYDQLKCLKASVRLVNEKIESVEPQTVAKMEAYLRSYALLQPSYPGLCHSMILNVLKRVGRFIPAFGGFLKWAGPAALRDPEDFVGVTKDGKQFPSLCTSVSREAVAWLEKSLASRKDKIEFVISLAESAYSRDGNEIYLAWDLARLYQVKGDFSVALLFVKRVLEKKDKEFWAWSKAGEILVADNQPELAIAAFSRSLSCGTKDEFLSPTRISLAKVLVTRSQFGWAAAELNRVQSVYEKQRWTLPPELMALLTADWARDGSPNGSFDLSGAYAEHGRRASLLRFDRVDEVRGSFVCIDTYLKRPRVAVDTLAGARALLGDANSPLKDLAPGDPLFVTVGVMGKTLRFLSARARGDGAAWDCIGPIESCQQPNEMAICVATGTFQETAQGFGFVSGVYVAAELAKNRVHTGDHVAIVAVRSMDRKKNCWGWKACAVVE